MRYIKIRGIYARKKWFRIKEVFASRKKIIYKEVEVEKIGYKDVYTKINTDLLLSSDYTFADFPNDKAYNFGFLHSAATKA